MSKNKSLVEHSEWDKGILSAANNYHRTNPGGLSWGQEKIFAITIVNKQDKSGIALRKCTPESLGAAVLQAGSIGLSLNPTLGHCYLIPYGQEAYASPSYKGLVQIAIATGAVEWATAEIICMNDPFRYYGPTKIPDHEINVFGDRGKVVGAYTVARLAGGDILSTFMSEQEYQDARKQSKAPNSLMHTKFTNEARKKTALRKAWKMWPKNTKRLTDAINIIDEREGLDLSKGSGDTYDGEVVECLDTEKITAIKQKLTDAILPVEKWITKICAKYGVKVLDLIPLDNFDEIIGVIDSYLENKKESDDKADK